MSFDLDERLAAASHFAGQHRNIQIRIADDARYLWCLLIPEENDITELHDLDADDQRQLLDLAVKLGAWLQHQTGADKINTATIGNVVSQLHLHVVCRTHYDAVWPAPIWGNGDAVPTEAAMLSDRIAMIEAFLKEETPR